MLSLRTWRARDWPGRRLTAGGRTAARCHAACRRRERGARARRSRRALGVVVARRLSGGNGSAFPRRHGRELPRLPLRFDPQPARSSRALAPSRSASKASSSNSAGTGLLSPQVAADWRGTVKPSSPRRRKRVSWRCVGKRREDLKFKAEVFGESEVRNLKSSGNEDAKIL